MRRTLWLFLSLAVFLVGVAPARAQGNRQAPPPPAAPGATEELLRSWNEVGAKLIEMAEDFPEDKYDFKPNPEVRSFAEQLLHVAGSTYFFMNIARGEQPGEEDLSREKYKTKAEVVAALKKSFAEGDAFIRQTGDAGLTKSAKYPWSDRPVSLLGLWADATEHAGEHYGQLVVYYRVNGLVPPASRPRR